MLKVDFYNEKPQNIEPAYVVIVARHNGKWVLVRHKERHTYEIPGGHIEQGENYLSAARRELYEETGAIDFSLEYVAFYTVTRGANNPSGGYLLFADIKKLSVLPNYEMAEVSLFEIFPENLTHPLIQPYLFDRVQRWLNLQSAKDEIWDVYDSNRNLTGETHKRGIPLSDGCYHLVVHVWVQNSAGEFLITKRTANKGYPHMWECTGGSALAGDNSISAAVREVKEETGLDILPNSGRLVFTLKRADDICDIWLFKHDCSIDSVTLQPNETCDCAWASKNKIQSMITNGTFIPFDYIEKFFETVV